MLAELADRRHLTELARWSEPLVADVVSTEYGRLLKDHAQLGTIVRCHVLLWRGLLTGGGNTDAYCRELARLARRAGLGDDEVERANMFVMDELMQIIATRYTRSPREAAALSVLVARAACRLTEASLAVPA